MEYLVEVFEGLVFPKRELICDFCNATLYPFEENGSFFVKAYEEEDRAYIEEFLCQECKKRLFPKMEVVNFEDADLEVKEAIRSITERPYHGYIVEVSDWDQVSFFINHSFLIPLFGEEF